MKPLSRQSKCISPLEERLKKIKSELNSIDERIELLSRQTESYTPSTWREVNKRKIVSPDVKINTQLTPVYAQPQTHAPVTKPLLQKTSADNEPNIEKKNISESHVGNERFAEYIAKNFGIERRLKNEERVRRNQAIVITIAAIMALLWLISKIYGF